MFIYYVVLYVTYYNQQTLNQFLKHFWYSYSYLGTSCKTWMIWICQNNNRSYKTNQILSQFTGNWHKKWIEIYSKHFRLQVIVSRERGGLRFLNTLHVWMFLDLLIFFDNSLEVCYGKVMIFFEPHQDSV